MSDRLKALAEAGVSIWLDDLSRERIATGNLADLVKNRSVVGVTTNPTIFAGALANGEQYDDQARELAGFGTSVDDAVFELTTEDVRQACDVLLDTWTETGGVDGRVSIEVPPTLAAETEATVIAARRLWMAVQRPNLLVKIRRPPRAHRPSRPSWGRGSTSTSR
jgi:transaldolase